METKVEKVSAEVQEQTIQGQMLPEQNKMGNKSQKKLMDERLALLIASDLFTTDDWEEGLCTPPRHFAIPKGQLTEEEFMSLWEDELPNDASIIALHPLETCINNFPSGYFTDLAGDRIKPRNAEQYVVIIHGFDAFKEMIIEYLSNALDDYQKTKSNRC